MTGATLAPLSNLKYSLTKNDPIELHREVKIGIQLKSTHLDILESGFDHLNFDPLCDHLGSF